MAHAMTTGQHRQVPLDEAGDCSCCGAEPTPDAPVYIADGHDGWRDADGEIHPRLCRWCLHAIEEDLWRAHVRAEAAA